MIESGDMAGTIYTNSWDGSTAAKIALLMVGSDYSSSVLTATPQVIMEPVVVTKIRFPASQKTAGKSSPAFTYEIGIMILEP